MTQNTLDGINNRLDITEGKKISEFKVMVAGTIQNKKQREKN